jgi:hypothetical protein
MAPVVIVAALSTTAAATAINLVFHRMKVSPLPSYDTSMATTLLKLRIGDHRMRATVHTNPIRTFVARCEEDYNPA